MGLKHRFWANLIKCSLRNVENYENLSITHQEMINFGQLLNVTNMNRAKLHVYNGESNDLETVYQNSV